MKAKQIEFLKMLMDLRADGFHRAPGELFLPLQRPKGVFAGADGIVGPAQVAQTFHPMQVDFPGRRRNLPRIRRLAIKQEDQAQVIGGEAILAEK